MIINNDNKTLNGYGEFNGYNYTKATIDRFKEASYTLRRAAEMAKRIDWLVSCDDDEESFHRRWAKEVRPEYLTENLEGSH